MIFWWWLIPAISVSLAVGVAVGWYNGRAFERCAVTGALMKSGPQSAQLPLVDPLPQRERECSYPMCKEPTGSDWDDRCYSHSLYQDGGRP